MGGSFGTPRRGGTGGPSGGGGEGRGILLETGEGLTEEGEAGAGPGQDAAGKKAWAGDSRRVRPWGGGSRWRGEPSGSRGGSRGGLSGGDDDSDE